MANRNVAAIGKEMSEVQLFALKSILSGEEVKSLPETKQGLLHAVLDSAEDVVIAAFGANMGTRIRRFAAEIDLEHPSISEIFDGAFDPESNLSQTGCDVLKLSKFARAEKLSIADRLYNLLDRNGADNALKYNRIERTADAPSKNQLHVRLMKTREERDAVRATKRMQVMELGTISKRGQELWDYLPDSFLNFVRGRNIYDDSIKDGKDKADIFDSLGLSELAGGIRGDVAEFQKQVDDTYYGFNRIAMTNASIIQAKILGFEMGRDDLKKNWKVSIPTSYFGDFKFWSKDYTANKFEYSPRSYTLAELQSIMPASISKIIDRLEAFPEAGGKAIFDHFRILVPSVNYPPKGYANSCSVVIDKQTKTGTYNEVAKILDKELIIRGLVNPILFAEKDENCYFISYWS